MSKHTNNKQSTGYRGNRDGLDRLRRLAYAMQDEAPDAGITVAHVISKVRALGADWYEQRFAVGGAA